MKFFKRGLLILLSGILLLSCTACSGLESLNDGLKGGVQQFGDNIAIGKSNALITPYQSFDGTRTSDNTAFLATYSSVSGTCQLVYIDPELEETVLAENGDGSATVQLKSGANYIGIYGTDYEGTIQVTVE